MAIRYLGFWDLQQAVYIRLTTHALTLGYSTYNYVPDNTPMPYISFGGFSSVDSATFSSRAAWVEDNIFMVHVWSDYLGDREAAEMMDNIIQAITNAVLVVGGCNTHILRHDYSEIIIDDTEPAVIVRHGVIRFRVIISNT